MAGTRGGWLVEQGSREGEGKWSGGEGRNISRADFPGRDFPLQQPPHLQCVVFAFYFFSLITRLSHLTS